jgi:hypothetical protein
MQFELVWYNTVFNISFFYTRLFGRVFLSGRETPTLPIGGVRIVDVFSLIYS